MTIDLPGGAPRIVLKYLSINSSGVSILLSVGLTSLAHKFVVALVLLFFSWCPVSYICYPACAARAG